MKEKLSFVQNLNSKLLCKLGHILIHYNRRFLEWNFMGNIFAQLDVF